MSEKRLYLSRSNRMIGGVAGGIAEYFSIDATVVRIVLLLLLLPGGAGLLAYIAAMIIIPERPRESGSSPKSTESSSLSKSTTDNAEEEAIHELKQAARELADAGTEAASDAAARVRSSLASLNKTEPTMTRGELHRTEPRQEDDSNKLIGLVLIALGFFFLARTFIPWIPWNALWPLALIIIGGVMLLGGLGDRE